MNAIANSYRSKLRILLILYYFSEDIKGGKEKQTHIKQFKSEVRIQKIDFLIRYPDYLAAELLELIETSKIDLDIEEIKATIISIFKYNEPEIRREDMLRFFFGAYEDIDDIIAFLISVNFIEYTSKRSIDGRIFEKVYYLTDFGVEKIEKDILINLENAFWYKQRCELIRKYFGNLSGTELKIRQYEHQEYRNTPLNQYINGIQEEVKEKFYKIFGEELIK